MKCVSLLLTLCALLLAPPSVSSTSCTTDVKPCPDGSFVGREGPNCDFAVCPTTAGSTAGSGPIPCQADAKLCPDGSYVGREGPNCEFKPCNGTQSNNETSSGSRSNEVSTPTSPTGPVPSPTKSTAAGSVLSVVSIAIAAVAVVGQLS